MVFDNQGRLIVCERKGLSRTEKDSTITKLITADTLGTEGPNDLTLTSSGGIFFTSSVCGSNGKVFYLAPDCTLKTVLSFTNPPLNYPNGIEFVEECRLLYINITQKDSIFKYHVDNNMNLTRIGALCKTPSPDGLALDIDGNLWVANTNGNHQITVFDSTGTKLGYILIDDQESIQNCAFGGADMKTLYITGKTAVFSLKTIVAGRNTTGFTSVIKSPKRSKITASPCFSIRRGTICWNSNPFTFNVFNLQGVKLSSVANMSVKSFKFSNGIIVVRTNAEKAGRIPLIR
jgi:gluconolactonase